MRSGRFTPAAATLIRTSSTAATGSGRSTSFKTSGPPGCEISIAFISSQPRRQPGRREQIAKHLPAILRAVHRTAALLDVLAHQILAEVVVDHVAAVLVEEPGALFRAIFRRHGPALQVFHRSRAIDFP